MYEKRRASGGRLWVAAICALVLCGCAETRVGGPKCQPDASRGQRCGSGDVRDAASAREDSGPEGGAGAAGSAATAADARAPEDADAGPNPATDAATDAAVDASADASPPPFLPCDTEDARLCTIDFPPGTDRLEPSDVSADASTVAGTAWIARVGSTIVGPPFYAWTWTLAARTTTLTVAPQNRLSHPRVRRGRGERGRFGRALERRQPRGASARRCRRRPAPVRFRGRHE